MRKVRPLQGSWDWTVRRESRVGRLPSPLVPLGLAFRNLRILVRAVAARVAAGRHGYVGDGITTHHNTGFMNEREYERAHAAAVDATGWDYGIEWRLHQALWCAGNALHVPGDFVELGTGRGFIMAGVLAGHEDAWKTSGKRLWLCDTFDPGRLDEAGHHGEERSPLYARSFTATSEVFARWPNVELIQGRLPGSLDDIELGRVAFLHIDLNHEEAETASLRRLWDQVAPGGIVLLDDYAFEGCEPQYHAMKAVAADLDVSILTTPTGQGLILKPNFEP